MSFILLNNGVIYELKTVKTLDDSHKQQLINYLLLTGIKHGKLLNLKSSSVEYEYVSTTLTKNDRYNYNIDFKEFIIKTDKCAYLKKILIELLEDWGMYLDINLYNQALMFFLGGHDKIVTPIDIFFNNKLVGTY